jgi:hypothetical protein
MLKSSLGILGQLAKPITLPRDADIGTMTM